MLIPILSVSLLFFSILLRKDKQVFFVLLLFMFIVSGFNYANSDYKAYEVMYHSIRLIKDIVQTDIGYGFLNYLGKYLHLSFAGFRVIYILACMALLGSIIFNNSPYPSLVLALYFVAPFFPNNIIQIRNFLSELILTLFLIKWINSNKNIVWFFLAILGASLIHTSALYFLIFLLIYFIKDDKKLFISSIVFSLFVGSLPKILRVIPLISTDKISFYLGVTNNTIDLRGVVIIVCFIIQLLIVYKIKEYSLRENNLELYNYSNVIYKMDLLCLPACAVMLVWTFNFYRVPRDLLLINYILYSKYLQTKKNREYIDTLTVVFLVMGVCWSMLNSFSQWMVVWSNNRILI